MENQLSALGSKVLFFLSFFLQFLNNNSNTSKNYGSENEWKYVFNFPSSSFSFVGRNKIHQNQYYIKLKRKIVCMQCVARMQVFV